MGAFRIKDAAELLGSATLLCGAGPTVEASPRPGTPRVRLVIDGVVLAWFAEEIGGASSGTRNRVVVWESVRNRFTGLVTRVVRDNVMAQVEIQSGPHRFVSLLSREAGDDLGLEPECWPWLP